MWGQEGLFMVDLFSQLFSHPLFIPDLAVQSQVLSSDKLWQSCLWHLQQHQFHTHCLQARNRMLYEEAKGFIQNWQKHAVTWNTTLWLSWEMEQNKELDIQKLLCWHFTTVFGVSSHWLDPNQIYSICCNHLFRKGQYQSLTEGCTSGCDQV